MAGSIESAQSSAQLKGHLLQRLYELMGIISTPEVIGCLGTSYAMHLQCSCDHLMVSHWGSSSCVTMLSHLLHAFGCIIRLDSAVLLGALSLPGSWQSDMHTVTDMSDLLVARCNSSWHAASSHVSRIASKYAVPPAQIQNKLCLSPTNSDAHLAFCQSVYKGLAGKVHATAHS